MVAPFCACVRFGYTYGDMTQMLRLMLVDDHEVVRLGMRALLERHPTFSVVGEASSEDEAVALALELEPDLVLMDIQLPDINGIEAFTRIRADAATAKVPVVAFTASVTVNDRSRIGDAGFDGFLGKPINLKEFLETVRRVLGEGTA